MIRRPHEVKWPARSSRWVRVWVADRARRGGSRQWQEVCNVRRMMTLEMHENWMWTCLIGMGEVNASIPL